MTKPNHFLRSPSAVGGRRGAESLAAFTPPGRRPRDPGGAVAAAAHRGPAPVLAALTFALGLVVAAPPLAASAQGQNLSMELSVSAPQCASSWCSAVEPLSAFSLSTTHAPMTANATATMPANDASVGLLPVLLASTHFVSFVVGLSQVGPNGHSTPVSQYTFDDPFILSYVLQDDSGTGASVQIAFSSRPGAIGGPPVTVAHPSTEPTTTRTAGLSRAPGVPQAATQDALASPGVAELSLTTGNGTVTNEALTGFSLSVLHLGLGTMYGDSASIEVTATMPVDSTSAADLLEAALGGTVYKSALIAAHNLAANSTFKLARRSITAHLLQVGASGDLVQVVITGAFQASSPPTTGNLIVNGDFSKPNAGGSGSSKRSTRQKRPTSRQPRRSLDGRWAVTVWT